MKKRTPRGIPPIPRPLDPARLAQGLFVCRLLTGLSFIYLALGCLFYWREFLVNTHFVGLPFAWPLSALLAGAELFVGLFLLLGKYTRISALVAIPLSILCVVIFFAGHYNGVFWVTLFLIGAALSVPLFIGPGAISLDEKRKQEQMNRYK